MNFGAYYLNLTLMGMIPDGNSSMRWEEIWCGIYYSETSSIWFDDDLSSMVCGKYDILCDQFGNKIALTFSRLYMIRWVLVCLLSFAMPVHGEWWFWLKWVDYEWWVKDIQIKWVDTQQDDKLIDVIKWWINRVLWILWLIALIVLLWWWFQMVTAGGDEKKNDIGLQYLKTSATALIYIGVAWFIVSLIFYIINLTTK